MIILDHDTTNLYSLCVRTYYSYRDGINEIEIIIKLLSTFVLTCMVAILEYLKNIIYAMVHDPTTTCMPMWHRFSHYFARGLNHQHLSWETTNVSKSGILPSVLPFQYYYEYNNMSVNAWCNKFFMSCVGVLISLRSVHIKGFYARTLSHFFSYLN